MSTSVINIEKIISRENVKKAIATIFNIPEEKILIEHELTGDEDITYIDVICVYTKQNGEFPLNLEIFHYKDGIEGYKIEKEVANKLSCYFHCRTIIIEHSDNPYIWLMIDKDGKESRVSVDSDKLDDCEEFYITGVVVEEEL